MAVVKFTETVFSDSGKKGILVPDANGYYEMILGGLNTHNSAGEYYTSEQVIELFESSSQLQRRVRNGALYAELGHPKPVPGQPHETFYRRVLSLEETNQCAHISEITLDTDYGKKHPELGNPKLIAIIGKVKPAGAKAGVVQEAFDNPKQSAAFSIRGITDNKLIGGKMVRRLVTIVTFDFVMEPGIAIATKWRSPSMESEPQRVWVPGHRFMANESLDFSVDTEVLRRVAKENLSMVGMESSRPMFEEIISNLAPKASSTRLKGW